jgi:hypothetical protein
MLGIQIVIDADVREEVTRPAADRLGGIHLAERDEKLTRGTEGCRLRIGDAGG